ncbi:MAG: hypothetical protein KF712_16105 [Akkermansiaceae bacterium]|nr:hypothetical protein [Akkermansiaceae bacterium]
MSNSTSTSTMETKNNTTSPDTSAPSGPSLELGISTSLPFDPDFLTKPVSYARKAGVALVAAPALSTNLAPDRKTKEKILRHKANIHLVDFGAIRLFARIDGSGDRMTVKTIDIAVELLLYGDSDHPLAHDDVAQALTRVQREIAPLLAHENDRNHIVPGLAKRSEARAAWRHIMSTVTYMHTPLHECYNVAHPDTGAAGGATRKLKKLGEKGDNMIITFESVKVPVHSEDTGSIGDVPGIRVAVSLRGTEMIRRYRESGGTARIGENFRLTRFAPSAPAAVHEAIMSELEGVHVAPSNSSETGHHTRQSHRIYFGDHTHLCRGAKKLLSGNRQHKEKEA